MGIGGVSGGEPVQPPKGTQETNEAKQFNNYLSLLEAYLKMAPYYSPNIGNPSQKLLTPEQADALSKQLSDLKQQYQSGKLTLDQFEEKVNQNIVAGGLREDVQNIDPSSEFYEFSPQDSNFVREMGDNLQTVLKVICNGISQNKGTNLPFTISLPQNEDPASFYGDYVFPLDFNNMDSSELAEKYSELVGYASTVHPPLTPPEF